MEDIEGDNCSLSVVSEKKKTYLIPVIVYTGMMMLVGVVGNVHVFIAFCGGYKRNSTFKVFVISLAVIDLSTCCTTMPFEIVLLCNPVTFCNEILCKTFRFINSFLGCSSILLLVTIAFERHRRVIYPFKTGMGLTRSKLMTATVIFVAMMLAVPNGIFQGIKSVNLSSNVTGYECGIRSQYTSTPWVQSYSATLFIIFIISSVVSIVLYLVIWFNLKGRIQKRRSMFSELRVGNMSSLNRKSHPDYTYTETKRHRSTATTGGCSFENRKRIHVSSEHSKINVKCISFRKITSENGENITTFTVTKVLQQSNSNTGSSVSRNSDEVENSKPAFVYSTRKCTRILFMITLVCLVSHLPLLVIQAIEAVSPLLEFRQKYGIIYKILNRLYYFNSIVNPFVYSFNDKAFREELKKIYQVRIYNYFVKG